MKVDSPVEMGVSLFDWVTVSPTEKASAETKSLLERWGFKLGPGEAPKINPWAVGLGVGAAAILFIVLLSPRKRK